MKKIKIFLTTIVLWGLLSLTSCEDNPNNLDNRTVKAPSSSILGNYYVPDGYYYTADHEWVRLLSDSTIQVGITSFGLTNVGNVISIGNLDYADMPSKKPRKMAIANGSLGAFDFIVPIEGYLKNFNPLVLNLPILINAAPYENWVYSMDRYTPSHLTDSLMSASQYRSYIGQ